MIKNNEKSLGIINFDNSNILYYMYKDFEY